MNTEEIVLAYWKSWHNHNNWETTRSLMQDDFKMDAGFFKTDNADQLIEMMKMGNPWKDITLIDILTSGEKTSLTYEGVDSVTGNKIRISEVISVRDGKVASCLSTISTITPSE